jgi:hypothetical protein
MRRQSDQRFRPMAISNNLQSPRTRAKIQKKDVTLLAEGSSLGGDSYTQFPTSSRAGHREEISYS